MKLVRFVFYRARFDVVNVIRRKRKFHIIDDLISGWTGLFNWRTPPYSHMSVWVPGKNFFGGDCFRSGRRDYVPCEHKGCLSHVSHPCEVCGRIRGCPWFGTCYTSTMRRAKDGTKVNGTVSRPASGVFKDAGRWEYIEVEVTDDSFERAKIWADYRVENNKGYGKKTILRFFLPLLIVIATGLDDPLRDICSEFGEGWGMQLIMTEPVRMVLDEIFIRSPRRLWRDLVRRHHVPTYSLATGKMVRDEKGRKVHSKLKGM